MSMKVFERLKQLMIETTHEERQEIDREIEEKTEKYCDDGIDDLPDSAFIEIVNRIKKRKKKKISKEETPLMAQ